MYISHCTLTIRNYNSSWLYRFILASKEIQACRYQVKGSCDGHWNYPNNLTSIHFSGISTFKERLWIWSFFFFYKRMNSNWNYNEMYVWMLCIDLRIPLNWLKLIIIVWLLLFGWFLLLLVFVLGFDSFFRFSLCGKFWIPFVCCLIFCIIPIMKRKKKKN